MRALLRERKRSCTRPGGIVEAAVDANIAGTRLADANGRLLRESRTGDQREQHRGRENAFEHALLSVHQPLRLKRLIQKEADDAAARITTGSGSLLQNGITSRPAMAVTMV